jgi:hypothetical protein
MVVLMVIHVVKVEKGADGECTRGIEMSPSYKGCAAVRFGACKLRLVNWRRYRKWRVYRKTAPAHHAPVRVTQLIRGQILACGTC